MFCDKFVFLFFFSLLTIVWRDVHSRDVNENKIVVNPVDTGTPGGDNSSGGKKGSSGDEKANKADKVGKPDEEEEDEPDVDVDADETEDASPEGEATTPKDYPTEGKDNQENNMDAIINEYYTNVLIPKESKDRAEMEEEKNKMSLITRIKKFFTKKEEETEENPPTLIEYIRQKNKKIWDLEEEKASRDRTKSMYKYLFWTTAYLLINVAIIPFLSYFYMYKRVKNTIMEEYKNNPDRRLVPYNYDFSSNRPSVKISGRTFRNCRYYPPKRRTQFPFLVGMLNGSPYAIVKL
ncbi:Uncharacterized protein PCOAH_00012650 [Plasmodium coatneyi]|uniref:Uncharacterized protein n=1 Tax=Plasmodium coatneyi TaxID=208452 RepID=A0A1B1DVS7_9APIC|nr:Uncharacterized protein PCOAH_00012650 [Plasmodium coatneyi]ANQ06675.1 Uncharacterized protein PCOAH_00012650 [Plasmodium coatneyi]